VIDMFGKSKDNPGENERGPAPGQHVQRLAVTPAGSDTPADTSSISSGMTIVGKMAGEGNVEIFGRIDGELRATTVLVAEGAEVEGDLVAEEVTIGGRVKGTVHGGRVRLNGTAVVEGDIFHRSLAIEENARFEGSSRREENVIDTPRVPLGQPPLPAETLRAAIEAGRKRNGAHDSGDYPEPAAE
jgi:cytoskeletal protein CcmA (bactofilin family)